MALLGIISSTCIAIRGAYALATSIKERADLPEELKETAQSVSTELKTVESIMKQLEKRGHQLPVEDQNSLSENIESVKSIADAIKRVLEKVNRKRGCIQSLFMKRKKYIRRLNRYTEQLVRICELIQVPMPGPTPIPIPPLIIPTFRSQFGHLPEKGVSIFDIVIGQSTPNTILTITNQPFDPKKDRCYMKLQQPSVKTQLFISYQMRIWSAPKPIQTIVEKRRKAFTEQWRNQSSPSLTGSISSVDSGATARSLPPNTNAASSINREKLDFLEFVSSNDNVCGMALTQSMMYIATKYQITVYSLNNREVLATFGTEGDGPKSFKHISDIYIPSSDETNLYIVDRGQNVVHWYRIIDSNPYLEYEHQYVVIGNQHQSYRLQSCVIYRTNLYVTDSGNRCIHVFPLEGERQSIYISDKSVTPFSPGPICAHGGYLYVADCSLENPSVLVLNEECEPVDWFRSSSIRQILAIDIERNMNELFILTTTRTEDETNEPRNRPLIVSMDLIIRPRTQQ